MATSASFAEKNKDWITSHIQHIRALKAPSRVQSMIISLVDSSDHQTSTKQLEKLLRAELAAQRLQKVTARAQQIVRSIDAHEKKTARQIRNKRLIDHGLLIELAGLQNRTDEELAGMLMQAAQADQERWARWASVGASRLAERDAARAKKSTPT